MEPTQEGTRLLLVGAVGAIVAALFGSVLVPIVLLGLLGLGVSAVAASRSGERALAIGLGVALVVAVAAEGYVALQMLRVVPSLTAGVGGVLMEAVRRSWLPHALAIAAMLAGGVAAAFVAVRKG